MLVISIAILAVFLGAVIDKGALITRPGYYLTEVSAFMQVDEQGFESADPIRGKPTTGIVKGCPLHGPGKLGDEIHFQWNAVDEASQIEEGTLIPKALVYKVGNTFLNNWVWVELHERPVDAINTEPYTPGRGKVIGCPKYSFISPGDDVVFPSQLSHRVVAEEFDSRPIYAVKLSHILLYR